MLCIARTVTPIPARQLKVITGEHSLINLDNGEEELPVIYTKAHELYDPISQLYNLGIIQVLFFNIFLCN